jgi:hypothetical protein
MDVHAVAPDVVELALGGEPAPLARRRGAVERDAPEKEKGEGKKRGDDEKERAHAVA